MAEFSLRHLFLGKPIPTSQAQHERLTNLKALAVFASDALSSTAYATEEILLVLITAGTGALSISIPLATLSNPTVVDFFAGYGSGGGYNSNESLPASAINSSGNPGFGDGQFGGLNTGGTYDNYNQFLIPEPASLSLLIPLGLLLARRR